MEPYSSGVPVSWWLEATFGTSLATWISVKCPSEVKTRMPLGFPPKAQEILPSGALISATMKFQVPMIWLVQLLLC